MNPISSTPRFLYSKHKLKDQKSLGETRIILIEDITFIHSKCITLENGQKIINFIDPKRVGLLPTYRKIFISFSMRRKP